MNNDGVVYPVCRLSCVTIAARTLVARSTGVVFPASTESTRRWLRVLPKDSMSCLYLAYDTNQMFHEQQRQNYGRHWSTKDLTFRTNSCTPVRSNYQSTAHLIFVSLSLVPVKTAKELSLHVKCNPIVNVGSINAFQHIIFALAR